MKRSVLFAFLSLFLSVGCSSWRVNETLKDIESFIMERPDSALAVLDSIDRTLLKTDRHKAHHALLHAMSLDKNYIDVDDDSLASVAVKYFSRKGPEKYHARSLYYLGLSYYYAQDYKNAILEFTKAEKVAERSDSLYLGMTKDIKATIYSATHNDSEALRLLKEAYDIYLELSLHQYINNTELRLANLYCNNDDFLKADSLYIHLISSEKVDDFIKNSATKNKAFITISHYNKDYDKAAFLYDRLVNDSDASILTYKDYWAYAYSLSKVGRKEEAQSLVSQLKSVDSSGTADYWMYLIEKSRGNSENALKYLEHTTTKTDKEVMKALQQSLALTQRDYYESEFINAEFKARNRQLIAISVGVSSVLVLVLLLWATSVYVRRQREEKEYYLNYANEIRRQLEDAKNEDYPQLKRKYLEIYKSKFEMIGSLYEEYVLYRGKKNAEHAIYSKVSEIINAFIGDNANQHQLESVLDDSLDGIVSMLRNEMPRLKDIDYSIFCYMIIGFDATTISHLLNITTNVVYIRRSRMRQHIEGVSPKHKDQFLNVLK